MVDKEEEEEEEEELELVVLASPSVEVVVEVEVSLSLSLSLELSVLQLQLLLPVLRASMALFALASAAGMAAAVARLMRAVMQMIGENFILVVGLSGKKLVEWWEWVLEIGRENGKD